MLTISEKQLEDVDQKSVRKILDAVKSNSLIIKEIVEETKVSKPTVSKILLMLRTNGTVDYKKIGNAKQYFLVK